MMSELIEVVNDDLDTENARYWDELCGTALADSLGIIDASMASLRKFDDHYFSIYPYLSRYLPFEDLHGKRVLEIGLGYGSVTQRLLESGAEVHVLDIASKPVAFSKHRAGLLGVQVHGSVGTAHAIPYPENNFDFVVSIGCFHHTGSIQRCIDETFRVLKPGGRATVMVYNALSYRQLFASPWRVFLRFLSGFFSRKERIMSTEQCYKYDANTEGGLAPYIATLTRTEFQRALNAFKGVRIRAENVGTEWILKTMERDRALRFGAVLGLDLYATAQKPE